MKKELSLFVSVGRLFTTFLALIGLASVFEAASAEASCRVLPNSAERCCAAEVAEPTWWCSSGTRIKLSTSCQLNGQKAVHWRCESSSGVFDLHSSRVEPKVVTNEALCKNGFESLCLETAKADVRVATVQERKARILDRSLRSSIRLQKEGGCRLEGEDPPGNPRYNAESTLNWLHNFKRSDRRFCFAKIVEREVFKDLGSILTKEKVQIIFESVRRHMISALQSEPSPGESFLQKREEMISEINRVQLIMADRFEEWLLLNQDPERVAAGNAPPLASALSNLETELGGGYCGHDFLKRNVISSSTGYMKGARGVHTGMLAVVICPGQLLEAAAAPSGSGHETLIHVLGHELGHHIHAVKNRPALGHTLPNGEKMTTNFTPAYGPMIDCLNRHYDKSLEPVKGQRGGSVRAVLGREPSDLELRLAEITADYWGTRVMDRYLDETSSTPKDSARVFANSFHRFCYDPSSGRRWTRDSSSHPGGKFRVDIALQQPMIRLHLGCKRDQPAPFENKPYCYMGGER